MLGRSRWPRLAQATLRSPLAPRQQLVNVGTADAPDYEERTLTITEGGAKTKDGSVSVSFVAIADWRPRLSMRPLTVAPPPACCASATTDSGLRTLRAADAEPVDGLSQTELNNFASWSGEGSVSASELLAGIAGATGVLFYDRRLLAAVR